MVLVLDMGSVLGVAPVVSSRRLGVACEPISDCACFLHLCVSPYFPAHLGAADSDRREGSTDTQLELTGLISKEVIWGNHLFQGCYPLPSISWNYLWSLLWTALMIRTLHCTHSVLSPVNDVCGPVKITGAKLMA